MENVMWSEYRLKRSHCKKPEKHKLWALAARQAEVWRTDTSLHFELYLEIYSLHKLHFHPSPHTKTMEKIISTTDKIQPRQIRYLGWHHTVRSVQGLDFPFFKVLQKLYSKAEILTQRITQCLPIHHVRECLVCHVHTVSESTWNATCTASESTQYATCTVSETTWYATCYRNLLLATLIFTYFYACTTRLKKICTCGECFVEWHVITNEVLFPLLRLTDFLGKSHQLNCLNGASHTPHSI